MSNHSLFFHGSDGTAEAASSAQILAAARQVLAHRVRRGASLTSPKKVREYLSVKLGHLDCEIFGTILLDLCGAVIYVESFAICAKFGPKEIMPLNINE